MLNMICIFLCKPGCGAILSRDSVYSFLCPFKYDGNVMVLHAKQKRTPVHLCIVLKSLSVPGKVRSLSSALWTLTHLTALHLGDNSLSRIPPDIAKLHNLVYLDLSSNKIRSLPAELGNMVSLR